MPRQLTAVLAALLVAAVGCNKPGATTSNPASTEVSTPSGHALGREAGATTSSPAGKERSATGEAPPASWQTVKGSSEGITYSLQVPPDWKWDRVSMADKSSFTCTFLCQVKVSKAFSKETPDGSAKKRLDGFRILLKEEKEKGRLRDDRIIKVGDLDAVWLVIAVNPGGGSPTSQLKTQCFLRTAGHDIELECERLDLRPDRKEADFTESQKDFLKITQSFRITSVKDAKDK